MLGSVRDGALGLIPWEEEAGRGLREVLRDPRYDGTKSFHLVIGPEGGFAREEIDQARRAGFLPSAWAGGSSAWRQRRWRYLPSSSTNGAPSAARIRGDPYDG